MASSEERVVSLEAEIKARDSIILELKNELEAYRTEYGSLTKACGSLDLDESSTMTGALAEVEFDKTLELDLNQPIQVGKHVVLDFVEDSPMFRKQVEGFEASFRGLRSYLSEITSQTKAYVIAGKSLSEAGRTLAKALDSTHAARALFTTSYGDIGDLTFILSEFQRVLLEVQDARDAHLDTLETVFYTPLKVMMEYEVKSALDLQKEVAKLGEDYETLLHKSLHPARSILSPSHRHSSSSSSSSHSQPCTSHPSSSKNKNNTLEGLKWKYEKSRYDLVRYLNRFDGKKKISLVECIHKSLRSLMSFNSTLRNICTDFRESLVRQERKIERAHEEYVAEDKMWWTQRLKLEHQARASVYSLPIQLLSLQTHDQLNRNTNPDIQGYLYVRGGRFSSSSGAHTSLKIQKKQKRLWFHITAGKLYHIRRKDLVLDVICDLMLATVKDQNQIMNGFEIIDSTPQTHTFQAETYEEMQRWIDAARRSTESQLESGVGIERRIPAPSTRGVVSSSSGIHPRLTNLASPASLDTMEAQTQLMLQQIEQRNPTCADCSASPAIWSSINLGIVLCIMCSGIHRSLGVHVSKVRSLHLDAWEHEIASLVLGHLGNLQVNAIWEHTLPPGWTKPRPDSLRKDKTKFIQAKYIFRGFIEVQEARSTDSFPSEDLETILMSYIQSDDVVALMKLFSQDGQIFAKYHKISSTPSAKQQLHRGTLLHCCAEYGAANIAEFLMLNDGVAPLEQKNDSQELAYEVAKRMGHESLKLRLMQKMTFDQYDKSS